MAPRDPEGRVAAKDEVRGAVGAGPRGPWRRGEGLGTLFKGLWEATKHSEQENGTLRVVLCEDGPGCRSARDQRGRGGH